MLSTFGHHAERIRVDLPPDLSAIVYEDDDFNLGRAVLEAVARRERGERFYGLALVDDVRIAACNRVASEINRAFSDPTQRRECLAELARGELPVNGSPVKMMWDPAQTTARFVKVRFVLGLCDEVLFRSFYACSAYLKEAFYISSRSRRLTIPHVVPDFEADAAGRPSVLIWTGRRDASIATLALMGLDEFAGDVAYVGEAPLPNVRGRFVPREGGAVEKALGNAGCVVCVDPADPADAAAFSHRNMPVVAPLTSGAHEVVERVVVWDAADACALSGAVSSALGREA